MFMGRLERGESFNTEKDPDDKAIILGKSTVETLAERTNSFLR
jgi:hypothetical protein